MDRKLLKDTIKKQVKMSLYLVPKTLYPVNMIMLVYKNVSSKNHQGGGELDIDWNKKALLSFYLAGLFCFI